MDRMLSRWIWATRAMLDLGQDYGRVNDAMRSCQWRGMSDLWVVEREWEEVQCQVEACDDKDSDITTSAVPQRSGLLLR